MAGLSYRVMTLQTGIIIIIPACYRSVHYYWVHAEAEGESSHPEFRRRIGDSVAIDETKQKVNWRQLFVWSVIDTETRELLAIWASYQRSSFAAALVFVKRVLEMCTNKQACSPRRWRTVVSVGSEEIWSQVAPHHLW